MNIYMEPNILNYCTVLAQCALILVTFNNYAYESLLYNFSVVRVMDQKVELIIIAWKTALLLMEAK